MSFLSAVLFIASAAAFILGLKLLSKAATARRGNLISALGMLLAVTGTALELGLGGALSGATLGWVVSGLLVGALVGIPAARFVKMTSMPEMVALFNGSGGIASMLIGLGQVVLAGSVVARSRDAAAAAEDSGIVPITLAEELTKLSDGGGAGFAAFTIGLAILIGAVTFTGSIVAYGKLSEKISGKPIMYKGQQLVNAGGAAVAVVLVVLMAFFPGITPWAVWVVAALALGLGVAAVIPIGGADMPVVIALLNSYSGLAAAAAGFAIGNLLLIVVGSLVGASGLILTRIMCVAMNRSLGNVLFSGFGSGEAASGGKAVDGEAKVMSPQEAYLVLEAASQVIFVPGYGMAVAQAQHTVRELTQMLEANGTEVKFAIHPVAGRMPGHMSVLLAEADVDYDKLVEPDDVNPTMEGVDVAVVIGANDVVNPAAREDETSPLWGMPIIDVDRARTCFVLKRSLRPGYAGVENPLFFKDNTRMILGDAKKTIEALIGEFKDGG